MCVDTSELFYAFLLCILLYYQTGMLAMKRLRANVSCSLTKANGLSDMLLTLKYGPIVPHILISNVCSFAEQLGGGEMTINRFSKFNCLSDF